MEFYEHNLWFKFSNLYDQDVRKYSNAMNFQDPGKIEGVKEFQT